MLTEPKFKRPVKTGNTWDGLTKVPFTHPGLQYPWRFHCPQPLCFCVIHAATEKLIIERIENHTCPWYGGGTTTFSWGIMSDDYLTPIWAKLDSEVNYIKGTVDFPPTMPEDEIRQLSQDARLRARGLAEALAVLMPPFFSTGDEIVKEAIVRWERRQANLEYSTPGLGRYKVKRIDGEPDLPSYVSRREYDAKAPKPAPTHSLTDAEIAKIKASNGFPVAMLAHAFNTTEAVIKYVQAN